MKTLNKLISHSLRSFMFLLALSASLAQAEDVVLVPGYISGSVIINGVTTDSIYVQAYSGSENAYVNSNTSDYNLTVNVPDGGSLEYTVYAYAYSGNNYLSFDSQTVTVYAGLTSTLDFYVNPGTISGQVTLSGATLSYGYVYANSYSSIPYTNAQGYFSSDGVFAFPAQPNADIRLYGTVYDTNGNSYPLSEVTGVTLTTGSTIIQNWTVEAGTASISGTISLNSAGPVDYQDVRAYGPMNPAEYRYDNFGNYALTDLLAGDYTVYARLSNNNYDDYFYFPYALSNTESSSNSSFYVPVTTGDAVDNPIVADAKFINGYVSLSGSKGISNLNSGYVELQGIYQTPTYGGSARDNIDTNTGAIDLIATAGPWKLSNTSLNFYDSTPGSYLYSYINIYDYQATIFDLSAQDVINNVQLDYVTGTVTVNYSIEGGGTMTSPYLNAYCSKIENNQTLMSVSGYAYGPYEETETGSATFVGLPMNCNLTAYATVEGSQTTFGQLNVEILPGTDIVVDIGGPTLTVANPSPETYTTDTSVAVSGTATDDQGVASITVNGNSVTLVSTGNQDDPNEVQFSTTVASLSPGPNTIVTVATDQAGKMASDTRNVYLDASAPTLAWTPADGLQTTQASVIVDGTASDDVAISEIKVNGSSISFTSTDNPADANEVAFSTIVNLVDGDNAILVVAKDSSNRTANQTHTVTKIAAPLMCDADGDNDVDRSDILEIMAARNTPATGPDDPRDADGDGVITVLDARKCVLQIPR